MAVGVQQLHNIGIAHQDLKPSNVLVFNSESKIGDLGRASDKDHPFKYDSYVMPGDRNYAPVEQWYSYRFSSGFEEKFAADLYLLGSLFMFFFTGLSMSQCMFDQLKLSKASSSGTFRGDLPISTTLFQPSLPIFGLWRSDTLMTTKKLTDLSAFSVGYASLIPRKEAIPPTSKGRKGIKV